MERKNILKKTEQGISTLSATDFVMIDCDGVFYPLIRLVDGNLYQANGATYCLKADDIELDPVAETWIRE